MNTRYLGTLALFLAVSACGGKTDEPVDDADADTDADSDADTDTDTDADSTTPTDTGTDEEFFVVAGFNMGASFGWDNDAQSFVDVVFEGNSFPSVIQLTFGDGAWASSGGASGRSCVIQLPLTTPVPVPSWVSADPLIAFGADHQAADPALSDCVEAAGIFFDPQFATQDEFIASWVAGGWGAGVGQLRDEVTVPGIGDMAASVAGQLGTDVGNIFGGTLNNAILPSEDSTGNAGDLFYIAWANEIDATYTIQPTFIPGTAIAVPGGGVATGAYTIFTGILWTYQ